MHNKSCVEIGKGDIVPLKPFEILPFNSFGGFWLSKWQSRHNIGGNTMKELYFTPATWGAVEVLGKE